ncbi:MAG: DNA polymerase III subunit delta [Pyrinomonadaceae bacterium]
MVLGREDLRNQLKRHEIAPVYLLFGPETHLRDLAAKTIAERSFAEGDFRDFNDTSFSLNTEDNLRHALAAAEQLPMMASRRVIRITDVRISATGYRDTITEDHEPVLSAYFANPSPTSVVIFIADDLNGVRKMGKLMREKTTAVEFKPLTDAELTNWARDKFRDAGADIDNLAMNLLIARTGPDVRHLTNEINKLATAALPGNLVTAELIESLVPNTREVDNFELTKQLVAGKRSTAIALLTKILDDGAEPLPLLGLIAYNYRRLLTAKDMMERGVDRREVANVVKLRYNDQEPFLAAARRVEMPKLVSAIQKLAKTDLAIKTSQGGTGPAGARMQIEMLVCDLATM